MAGSKLFCINQQAGTVYTLLSAAWPKNSGLSVLSTLAENNGTNCFVNFSVVYCFQPGSPPTSLSPALSFNWNGSTTARQNKFQSAATSGWSDCFDDKNILYCVNQTGAAPTITSIVWPTSAQDAAVLTMQQAGYSKLFVSSGRLWGVLGP